MTYLSDSLATSYFDRAEIFAALREYAPGIILDEADGQPTPPESKPDIQEDPDWLKDYSGYASFTLHQASLMLAGIDPELPGWNYWDSPDPAAARHLGFFESRRTELGLQENSNGRVAHDAIRALCAKYGRRWPVPELAPIVTGASGASQEAQALRQHIEALTEERDLLRKELEQLRDQAPPPAAALPPVIPAGWVSVQLPHVSPAMADLFEVIRSLWGRPAGPSFTLLQKAVQSELEKIGYNTRDAQTLAASIKPDGPSRKKGATADDPRR